MSKVSKGKSQVNVRLSDDAKTMLTKLQRLYANRAGLPEPVSQAEALEVAIREAAKKEGVSKARA
ncbi:MAG TPA: hypothetical protein VK754_09755 [Propionibacteriaceae bacterium]|nr:hypothetical protein [Propionibacteriaceae bacterium]